ncbi:MAG: hypothetical protein M1820_000482 [Bogoriella megaspora]|nr:MAG: hypothetical protein M1820_000482 [Bogoriella megaspora]
MANSSPIPITIITGFLGSGKTTMILNLIPQMPDTKFAVIKNEFGDVAIDSQLASTSSIGGVRELLNGCICCNLVGQLSEALDELISTASPQRILLETSGSAFPATLALELNRLSSLQDPPRYFLDTVVCVIDVENWKGYEDTSYTAKLQARYTDLVVLNKWEQAGDRREDEVRERLGDLDVPNAVVKSSEGWVDAGLVFGGRSGGKNLLELEEMDGHGNGHRHGHGHRHEHRHDHQSEIEVLSVRLEGKGDVGVDVERLRQLLETAPKDEVYRIKAVLYARGKPKSSDGKDAENKLEVNGHAAGEPVLKQYILNWAFGRWTYTCIGGLANSTETFPALQMTIMTARGESSAWKYRIEKKELARLEDGSSPIEVKKVS